MRKVLGAGAWLLAATACWLGSGGETRLYAAEIAGYVYDAAARVVAGAEVTLVRPADGSRRLATTNVQGFFSFPGLAPGRFRLQVTSAGFEPAEIEDLGVSVDQAVRLEIFLRPRGPRESVTVESRSWELGVSGGSLGGNVKTAAIEELPLNGRDVLELAALTAVVLPNRNRPRNVSVGYGTPFSIAGARPTQNAFYLDGISIADHTGATPAGVTGVSLGLDTLQEFSVLTAARGAGLGRAAGGVINAVTRSGSNEFHGSAFYYLRDAALDARNFFDKTKNMSYSRHQGGFQAGFPLRRNVWFGFVGVEALHENDAITQIDTTLSEEARRGNLRAGAVSVAPEIAEILEAFPHPNGEILGDTALFEFINPRRTRQFSFTGRIDTLQFEGRQWNVRYSLDQARRSDRTTFDLLDRSNESRQQSLAINGLREISPRLLHSTRLGFSRSWIWDGKTSGAEGGVTEDPGFAFLPGMRGPGIIDVVGLSTFPGAPGALDSDRAAFTSIQFYQDVTWVVGQHSWAFGGSLERTYFNFDSTNLPLGEFSFGSLADFLTNRPRRFTAQWPGSDTVRGFRQWVTGLYIQDRWSPSPRVAFDLGLRFERASVPAEVNGKLANLDELTDPEMRVGEPLFEPPRGFKGYPHLGLAVAVDGDRKTIVRTGFGVYPELVLSHYLLLSGVRNPPFFTMAQLRDVPQGAFPSAAHGLLVDRGVPNRRAERIPRQFDQPYVQQWHLSAEHRFHRGRKIRLSYLGSHSLHLSTLIEDANLIVPIRLPDGRWYFPSEGERLNPHFGRIRDRLFEGHGFYHGFEAEWQMAEPWHGIQGTLGYSFGKSLDDSSTTFAQTEAVNAIGLPVHDPRFNRGPSNHDVRHRWVGHLVWEPSVVGASPWRRLLDGWRLALLWEATSGLPFSATLAYDAAGSGTSRPDYRGGQRPDLRPGASNNPVLGTPERWFDLSVFERPERGFLGNLGRNTLRGPAYWNLDLSLARRFPFGAGGEGKALEVRLEAFNLFNHTNLALPDPRRTMVFTADGVVEDAGRITEAYPARRIQIGLRWVF
ncbi:MAG: hypothetical protein Kow00109_09390 [Acidobacteriota bacterium]